MYTKENLKTNIQESKFVADITLSSQAEVVLPL